LADAKIINEGSLEDLCSDITEFVRRHVERVSASKVDPSSGEQVDAEIVRSLQALRFLRKAATCEEISDETRNRGNFVRRYNTNRALKNVPELARRIEKKKSLLKYQITPEGRTFLNIYLQRRTAL